MLWPVEVWFYAGSDRVGEEFVIVFYRRWGAGPFRVWKPLEGLDVLFVGELRIDRARGGHGLGEIASSCARDGDRLAAPSSAGWPTSA